MLDWREITGFGDHDFADFYADMVQKTPPNATLIEVGTYHGRSLVQLAQEAQKANKGLKLFGVDRDATCVENLKRAGVTDVVTFIHAPSLEAAKRFEDGSVWLVFQDGGHTHEEVQEDILAWMPKLTDGGIMGFHDYHMHTVCEPIHAMLEDIYYSPPNTAWVYKQTPKTGVNTHAYTIIPQLRRRGEMK